MGVGDRVDDLYAFFVQWSPDVYGKEAREQGFVVVEKDELDMIDNFFSDPASCSWEVCSGLQLTSPHLIYFLFQANTTVVCFAFFSILKAPLSCNHFCSVCVLVR